MNCPICNSVLILRETAPCYECGACKNEIVSFYKKYHDYYECTVFKEKAILCDFCYSDIDSYYPDFWGLEENSPLENNYPVNFIRKIDTNELKIESDFYCKECGYRLKFLKLVYKIRKK